MDKRRWSTVVVFGLAVMLAAGCGSKGVSVGQVSPEERGEAILRALKARDMDTLAGFVHPDKGLRFSPYLHVNLEQDVVLASNEMRVAIQSDEIRTWGVWDGSGEPIDMTFSEYLERFVYDHDYLAAQKVGVNESFARGNSLDNAREVYPETTIVEYYFAGFDPKYEGLDWRALKLVLENVDGQWLLVALVHGEWTI